MACHCASDTPAWSCILVMPPGHAAESRPSHGTHATAGPLASRPEAPSLLISQNACSLDDAEQDGSLDTLGNARENLESGMYPRPQGKPRKAAPVGRAAHGGRGASATGHWQMTTAPSGLGMFWAQTSGWRLCHGNKSVTGHPCSIMHFFLPTKIHLLPTSSTTDFL